MANSNTAKQKKIVLSLPEEMGKWIESYAAENDLSSTEVLRRAFNEFYNSKTQAA